MPKYEDFDYWPHIEIFFNACFSLEMLMRVVCTTSIRKTVKDIYFVFDFLSVFPSWLEVRAREEGAGARRALLSARGMGRCS